MLWIENDQRTIPVEHRPSWASCLTECCTTGLLQLYYLKWSLPLNHVHCVLLMLSLYRTRKKPTKKQLKHSRNRDPGYQLPNLVSQWATTQFLNLSHVKLGVQKSGTSGILKVTFPRQVAEFCFCTALLPLYTGEIYCFCPGCLSVCVPVPNRVHSISPRRLEGFSLNLGHMFTSSRRYKIKDSLSFSQGRPCYK